MTGKERILAALAGEKPDRVPFVPNVWQWFDVNDFDGTLPVELQGAQNAVEALKRMGAEVFSKFDAGWPAPISLRFQLQYISPHPLQEPSGFSGRRLGVWPVDVKQEKPVCPHPPFRNCSH
jgi:hypothetical protein